MRRSFVLSIVIATLSLVLGVDALQSADEPETLESLRKQKLKAAQEWRYASRVNHGEQIVTTTIYDGQFEASLALKDAQLETASSQEARIRALTTHRDDMKLFYDKISALHEAGAYGGEPHARAKAQFYFLRAKVWVKEEEMKP